MNTVNELKALYLLPHPDCSYHGAETKQTYLEFDRSNICIIGEDRKCIETIYCGDIPGKPSVNIRIYDCNIMFEGNYYVKFYRDKKSILELIIQNEFIDMLITSIYGSYKHMSNVLNTIVDSLINDNEIYTMAYNFVVKYTKELLVSKDTLYIFEEYLLTEHRRNKYPEIRFADNRNILLFEHDENRCALDEEEKIAELIYTNYFDKLVKIIMKKGYGENNFYADLAVWKLVYTIMIEHYAGIFEKEIINKNIDIKTLTVDECINQFFKAHHINKKEERYRLYMTCFLKFHKKFTDNSDYEFENLVNSIINITDNKRKNKELSSFEQELKKSAEFTKKTIDDIDLMTGLEFEDFVSELFSKLGYITQVTKASGDQGVDIIAEKNGIKLGIQAKCYAGAVSNGAVQEVVAGLAHYNLSKGIVVTNSRFTASAIKLARSNNIVLWDRDILKEKLIELN